MNGITILEEHLCRVVETPELIGIGIFMTLLAIVVLLACGYVYKNNLMNKNGKISLAVCLILEVVVCVFSLVFLISNYNKMYMEYTITVDDSVSFNDFFDKYEIVSVSGNEYRVVEK